METKTQPKRLSRGSFLTALALSVTGAMGILEGCGGGGGEIIGAVTRELLIARWNSISMSAEGKNTACPGSFTLSSGDVACGGFMEFKNDNTYVASFAGEADSGTWTLAGTTLTLDSVNRVPNFVMTITNLTASTLTIVSDGITVNHTKAASATPTPAPTPTPVPTPTPTPTPTPRPTIKKTFSYTGTVQSFVVPAGVTSIKVKLWGAGGGSAGGSGAFVSGNLAVTPGETLAIRVGQGGQSAAYGTTTSSAFLNGGTGTSPADGSTPQSGGGGGRTAIATSAGVILAIAGSGGGGSYYGGGGGGLETGLDNRLYDGKGGLGGTQTAGGAGKDAGVAGSSLTGGKGGRGGGGAGYFGGGGGGSAGAFGSGGGGSSYTAKLTGFSGATGANGDDLTRPPGGATDSDYVAGTGVGRPYNQAGGNGYIVISYQS